MAKAKFKAPGRGFLNGVDGVIEGYEFSTTFPIKSKNPKKKSEKTSDFLSLYMKLTVRVDGADKSIDTSLWGGDASNFEISDDKRTLTPIEGGAVLGGGTDIAHFIQSYDAAGEEGASSEDEEVINFEPIIDQRVRFVQVAYSADELAYLKRRGKPTTRTGKDGKEYPLQWLQVETVYGPAEVKTAGKGAVKAKAKSNGKAVASPSVDDLAISTLLDIVRGNGGSIAKSKLSMRVLKALTGNPQQNAVRTLVNTDEFLNQNAGWDFNEQTQTIEVE
jgi:hypothetical protein